MKPVLSRLFGSLKSGLLTGAIIGTAVMIPVAASGQAQAEIDMESNLGVANVTAGDTKYSTSGINATTDQTVKVEVYYHNQEDPTSNKIAKNVRVKIGMPTAAGKSQKITSSVKADNSDEVAKNVAVNLDNDAATLQYIPGSAVWKHNTGSRETPKIEETKVSDDIVLGAQGTVLEDEKPCYEYAATVTVLARVMVPAVKVTKQSELKGESNKWSDNNSAKPGDTMKYMISYQNVGNTQQKNVVITDKLPAKASYVPGSTMIYNTGNPNGVASKSDNVTDGGIIIGTYNANAGAYVTFEVKMADSADLQCGDNEIRNVGSAQPEGMSESFATAVTTVKRDCAATTTSAAVPTCDLLTVTKGDNNMITAKVDYTAKGGAKLKTATYDFGDGSTPLTTDKTSVDYTYATDGDYPVSVKLLMNDGSKDQTVTSAQCAKQVSAATTAGPADNLPATGAGNVFGIFLGATAIGFAGHRLFVSRRLARR